MSGVPESGRHVRPGEVQETHRDQGVEREILAVSALARNPVGRVVDEHATSHRGVPCIGGGAADPQREVHRKALGEVARPPEGEKRESRVVADRVDSAMPDQLTPIIIWCGGVRIFTVG
jgi:hypothetical protein